MGSLSLGSLSTIPEVRAGDDVAGIVLAAMERERPQQPLRDGDIVVVAQKIVSKAEGAVVDLAGVQPSAEAIALAAEGEGKDARAVQVVLNETAEIVRARRGVIICRTHHGFVCANAGVDASNSAAEGTLILLPKDPDASARSIRARLAALSGVAPAVLITDSFGRAWRHGQCDTAIGCAGLLALEDWRGRTDSGGRQLSATWLAVADALAAASDLARGKDSREPVVIVQGLDRLVTVEDGPGAAALLRPPEEDLFR